MFRIALASLLVAFSSPILAESSAANVEARKAALDLFERDWVLMNWALKFYDANHDALLEADEAAKAADAFRRLADTNNDGRVTQQEYRAARTAILTRY